MDTPRDQLPVYLDCAASSPMDPEVLEVVIQVMREEFGNPSSRTHVYGQRAKSVVERARDQVAAAMQCDPSEVLFTGGATESNNLAILGMADRGYRTGRRHVVASAIEHKSVLEPMAVLAERGFEVSFAPADRSGLVSASAILGAVRKDTLLVSLMGANNETGVIQPVDEIARALAGSATYLHVDAAQLFGKAPSDHLLAGADLISISGHKIGGPKGVGALICRRAKGSGLAIRPLTFGGGQERGLRGGTVPTPLVAGLGMAVERAKAVLPTRHKSCIRYRKMALQLVEALGATVNGSTDRCVPNILSITLKGIDSEAAIVALKDLAAFSTGSACTSQSFTPSHVLAAMGLTDTEIASTVRLSWCHETPAAPWDTIVGRLRQLAPSTTE